MRIVTRPDFDGIVCAVLLLEAENSTMDIVWMEPNEVQSGKAPVCKGDIMANLPWHPNAGLWFDHHVSNKPETQVAGAFDIAPSAAGVIYTYYKNRNKLSSRFDDLVKNTDMIDSADLTKDQVQFPENYPHVILSMTIQNRGFQDIPYWNRLVDMLKTMDIDAILADPEVAGRCQAVITENKAFGQYLTDYTTLKGKISVTDFRPLDKVPQGNRFLTYSLFPHTIASVKIRYAGPEKTHVLLSVGRSIFNPHCRVNIGKMLSEFGGGGHAGAGGCTLEAKGAQDTIKIILARMEANEEDPPG
ncbi:MAG: exopolyphosphatase [Desulfobacter sp.]|nr:exopolyphosphatase [Desulfobacter sp.]WDP83960.1 MAG: exopolyphosphatase [Desulfobacter sp.]